MAETVSGVVHFLEREFLDGMDVSFSACLSARD
jgi:hypothetical protein